MDAPPTGSPRAPAPFDPPQPPTARDALDAWRTGAEFITHNLPRAHALAVRLRPYPAPWRLVDVPGAQGARLAAWHGPGADDGPAVVMVPGTFQTKDDAPRRRRALDLWRRLGAHVLILDLRGFGGSHAHEGSGGLLEAEDALAAAAWLARHSGRDRVALWGESLGGAVVLLAGARPGAAERVSRVLAWSPFADLSDAILASRPDTRRGRTAVGRTYRWLLRRRTSDARDFGDYLRRRAKEMGLPLDELLVAGSPCYHCDSLQVPAHVFHALDDPIVPVTHARLLARIAQGHPHMDVSILPRGAHLGFDRAAPRWYAETTARLLQDAPAQRP